MFDFHQESQTCGYHLQIPTVGLCCDAYSQSKRQDGFHWANYPFCCEKDCPLAHPELLEGAVL